MTSGLEFAEPLSEVRREERDSTTDTSLAGFLTSEVDSFWHEEESAAEQRRRVAHKAKLFYLSIQITDTDEEGWAFPIDLRRDLGEIYWTDDQFGPMIDSIVKEIVKVRAQYDFSPVHDSVDEASISQIADAVAQLYQSRLLTTDFLQTEAKAALLDGDAFRFVDYYDPDKQSAYDEKPEIKMTCAECGAEPDLERMPPDGAMGEGMGACPECGGPLQPDQDEPEQKERRKGDIIIERVDAEQVCSNSWAENLGAAIWLRRKRWLDKAVVRDMHPDTDFDLNFTDTEDYQNEQRRRERLHAYGGANQEISRQISYAGMLSHRQVPYTEDWLDPVVYRTYKLKQRETLPDGTELPRGYKLSRYFPDGIKICRVGGRIVGLYNQDFHKHWVHFKYRTVPGRLWGVSCASACPIQEWINEFISLITTYAMEQGCPTRVYDGRVFPNGIGIGGRPSQMVEAKNRPQNLTIDQIYRIFPPGPLSDAIFAMLTTMKEELQAHLGAFSSWSGIPDAAANTARGLSLLQESALSLMAMVLGQRAQADAKTMMLVLDLWRENVEDERAFKIGGQYSKGQMRRLRGADLETSVEVTVREGSFMPRQQFQRRQDVVEYFQTRLAILQAKAALQPGVKPELTSTEERLLSERFNVPEVASLSLQAAQMADDALDFFKAECERMESPDVDPDEQDDLMEHVMSLLEADPTADPTSVIQDVMVAAILEGVPVRPMMDLHTQMVDYYREWGNTDEGRDASTLLMDCVERRIMEHIQADQELQMMMQPPPPMPEMGPEMMGPPGMGGPPGGAPTVPPVPQGGSESMPGGEPDMPNMQNFPTE